MRPVAIVLAALALAPTLAFAQSSVPEQIEGRPVTYKPVTEIELGGANVDATAAKPEGALVTEPARPEFHSFIVLRANFNPELDQSAALVK